MAMFCAAIATNETSKGSHPATERRSGTMNAMVARIARPQTGCSDSCSASWPIFFQGRNTLMSEWGIPWRQWPDAAESTDGLDVDPTAKQTFAFVKRHDLTRSQSALGVAEFQTRGVATFGDEFR